MEPIVFSIEERLRVELKDEWLGKSYNDMSVAIKDGKTTPEGVFNKVPFGKDYAGQFVLRYPTLGDRARIEAVQKRELKKLGFTVAPREALNGEYLPPSLNVELQEYAFAIVEVLAEDIAKQSSKPEWFDKDKLSSDVDLLAVIAVGTAYDEALSLKKKKSSETSKGTS